MKSFFRAILPVAVITTTILTALESTATAATLKVMPLGDSITLGRGDGNNPQQEQRVGYRGFLREQLLTEDKKNEYIFVGSQGKDPLKHEGNAGITINGINSNEAWNVYKPDIILLMAGTNDLRGEDEVGTALSDLNQLISNIRSDLPNVDLFVASIPPIDLNGGWFQRNPNDENKITEQDISNYNAFAPLIVNALKVNLNTKNLTFVDINKVLTKTDLMPLDPNNNFDADGLHPNRDGYRKIANEWERQIVSSPEPNSSIGLLLALGTLGAAFTLKRYKKQNKETIKVV